MKSLHYSGQVTPTEWSSEKVPASPSLQKDPPEEGFPPEQANDESQSSLRLAQPQASLNLVVPLSSTATFAVSLDESFSKGTPSVKWPVKIRGKSNGPPRESVCVFVTHSLLLSFVTLVMTWDELLMRNHRGENLSSNFACEKEARKSG